MARTEQVFPVYMVAGFLDSGKTSFINGILGAFVRGELPPERASAPVQTRLEDEP